MKFLKDNNAGAVPLLLFALTIVVCGAFYTLFFIEIAYPNLMYLVPSSDSKTFIMMLMYAIPLFVLLILIVAFLKSGLRERYIRGGLQ